MTAAAAVAQMKTIIITITTNTSKEHLIDFGSHLFSHATCLMPFFPLFFGKGTGGSNKAQLFSGLISNIIEMKIETPINCNWNELV